MVEQVPGERSPARWRRVDTGEVLGYNGELPPGAIWEAPWMGGRYRVNGSGPVLVVRLPGGHDWMPGSQASNCPHGRAFGGAEPHDHDCWCVHGEAPLLTVDKTPEPGRESCIAGGGSIQMGSWHGFLRDGKLVVA